MLRWVESGSGAPAVALDAALGEPGSLAWAGVLPAVAVHARVIAYDRAGIGASDPALPLNLETQLGDALPDVPVVVFSATTGTPDDQRRKWTSLHAELAAAVRQGRHIVLADTDHTVNQERPAEIAEAINSIISS
jgi:pimeloyl-ACP methyl ester carboxylesterase